MGVTNYPLVISLSKLCHQAVKTDLVSKTGLEDGLNKTCDTEGLVDRVGRDAQQSVLEQIQ